MENLLNTKSIKGAGNKIILISTDSLFHMFMLTFMFMYQNILTQ